MAGLKDIKRRIKSVGNTKKITYAMKLVSAAKLRKAQDAVKASRQYTDSLIQIAGDVFSSISEKSEISHELLEEREEIKSIRIVVIGGSRGLCGAFNSNVNKKLASAIKELGEKYPEASIDTYILGKKPREYVVREGVPHVKINDDLPESALAWPIDDIASDLEDAFIEKEADQVYVLYTKFKSAMSQSLELEQILPLSPSAFSLDDSKGSEVVNGVASSPEESFTPPRDAIFEPSPERVFKLIVPRILRTRIQQAGLDTKASEHGSRMVAMDSATKNAGDLSKQLKLKHNKLRQGAITSELLDIIGGAEAVND